VSGGETGRVAKFFEHIFFFFFGKLKKKTLKSNNPSPLSTRLSTARDHYVSAMHRIRYKVDEVTVARFLKNGDGEMEIWP